MANAVAQNNLAHMYHMGEGVKRFGIGRTMVQTFGRSK